MGRNNSESLIEEAGLKGLRLGEAEISPRSPNFIVVGPKAKTSDVLELIEQVRRLVLERTGTKLESAIEVW